MTRLPCLITNNQWYNKFNLPCISLSHRANLQDLINRSCRAHLSICIELRRCYIHFIGVITPWKIKLIESHWFTYHLTLFWRSGYPVQTCYLRVLLKIQRNDLLSKLLRLSSQLRGADIIAARWNAANCYYSVEKFYNSNYIEHFHPLGQKCTWVKM